MNKIRLTRILLLIASVICLNYETVLASKVQKINIAGNQRVETSTIRQYLVIDEGDEFTAAIKHKAIKSLYQTELFDNINISFNNGTVNVQVAETPLVGKIVFTGNYKMSTDNLAKIIDTVPGQSLRRARIITDTEKIKGAYKHSGRFAVQVGTKIENLENNRAKVIFEIKEGPKTGIKSINFVGNTQYRDSELKSVILTKESRWFRFLETNDTYNPERLELDKQLLKEFYNSVGYANFQVVSVNAELMPTKEGFNVTYSISEGEKYKFGTVELQNSITEFNADKLKSMLKIPYGKTFDMSRVENSIERISAYLSKHGYHNLNITPDLDIDHAKNLVNITIRVRKSSKVYINKIKISGNLKTQDQVIRRQIPFSEGDAFDRSKLNRGERNIRNLDYFAQLQLNLIPTKYQDRYDVNVNVQEKSTSSIGFDVGYNSAGGPFGRISFLERNLVGTGKILNAGVQMGRKNVQYNLGLTEPNFMNKNLSLGGSVFRSKNGAGSGFVDGGGDQNYAQDSMGASISLGYDITSNLSHDIDYSIKQDKLTLRPVAKKDKAAGNKERSILIQEQMGKFITSSIGHTLSYDYTDSRILPKNGFLLSASQDFAGVGGDNKFLRHEARLNVFKSFINNKYTLKFSANGGNIKGIMGKKVRINDRFNLGDYKLRGFAPSGIGPRDKLTGEAIGGQNYYSASLELSFPLGLPEEFNVTGAVFYDMGGLWGADTISNKTQEDKNNVHRFYNDKSMRSSVGFGFLWVTRIAPIRLDWGFAVKKQKYDDVQRFHIKFSTHL